MERKWIATWIIGLCGLFVACTPSDEVARRSWLQNQIVEDDLDFLDRDPLATAAKWEKMASDPYLFFRGTSGIYLADMQDPGQSERWATRYGSAPSSQIAMMGDPHPENLGSFLWGDETMSVEYNDFDGALYGPYYLGVRRLANGFGVLARRSGELSAEEEATIVASVPRGYSDEIAGLLQGQSPVILQEGGPNSTIVDDLLRRARRDGEERENLERYVDDLDGEYRFKRGDLEPPEGNVLRRRLIDLTIDEEWLVEGLLTRYPASLVDGVGRPPDEWILLDAVRRWGAGVSSYPGLRYYILLQLDQIDGPESLVILELKELRDPSPLGGLSLWPPRHFESNGRRVVTLRRAFHPVDNTDPWLGWASEGAQAFRVRHLTRFQRNISVDRITRKLEDGEWDAADLEDLAYEAGRLLARGHGMAPGADGTPGLASIGEAMGEDSSGFVEETTTVATEYIDRVFADYERFLDLLDGEGPLLGYRPAAERSR